ncbi:hypothetical protein CBR_g8412 [Chara braunii]|uniref:CCHC-type domain-containing protein n=1 Tax=Chara braunii TaxID=69332 RepID=A0A388KME9_CHABU|nr:hypothetical protein CBR_g8412 [Chara braunii]|eukprot:GBG71113.1 hypothetical protein CBR_g8412 [Chara braunii]
MQERKEDQADEEKELDRIQTTSREKEIKVQLRLKNLAELNEKMHQGEQPEEVEDKSGKSVCTQKGDLPLFSEVWVSFDKLMEAAGRSREHHEEMGIKLVSTDLLNLKGLLKKGFAAAKASAQKVGERLTKVAQKVYGQRVDWEREVEGLKKELGRQSKEMDAAKVDMMEIRAENEAIKHVNQILNKVNDVLRVYLQAQQVSFQAMKAEWEKRIKDLEAKCAQQAPIAVVDWTEVQGFEIRRRPTEKTFKSQKKEKKADLQEGEEVPLIDKEMLNPHEELVGKDTEGGEFKWRMPADLTLGQEPAKPKERSPAEAMRIEVVPPITKGETVGQQEVQESVGQTMVEAELRVDPRGCQGSTIPQDMPLVADLRDALGSWATDSGPEGRVSEQVTRTDGRAACPTSPKVPQQEVTSKVTATPSSVPSQEGDKMSQKKIGKCFYCKKGKHRSFDCPKSLKDEANGLAVRESSGVWRDRNEILVPKTRDGARAQLYRQLQEVMSDRE